MVTVSLDTVKQIGVLLTALTGAITLYKKAIKPIVKGTRKYITLFDSLEGAVKELTPNGGSSLRDAISRIEQATIRNEARQKAMLSFVPHAVFEADSKGYFYYLNRVFTNWTSRPVNDLIGKGWISIIQDKDRVRISEAWEAAVEEKRLFEQSFQILTQDGKHIPVVCRAYPTLSPQLDVLGFVGILVRKDSKVDPLFSVAGGAVSGSPDDSVSLGL